MAKPKTKLVPFDRVAVENMEGMYQWEVGQYTFRWYDRKGCVNLSVLIGDEWHVMVFVQTLIMAGYFAEGFVSGRYALDCMRKAEEVKAAE